MKISLKDSKGFFPEKWYIATISNIETYKTRFGIKLLFWFEIKNDFGRSMKITDFFPREYTTENRTGKITKLILGEHPKEFSIYDLTGQRVNINLKKKIKKNRSYLNIVGYSKVTKEQEKLEGQGGAVDASEGDGSLNAGASPSPEQIAELLKDPNFAAAVTNALKKPKKKNDPKSMREIIGKKKGHCRGKGQ